MKRDDKSLGDSFINDANMITEIFESQHTRQVSNLDLTFEKSIEKGEKSPYDKTKLINYEKKNDFLDRIEILAQKDEKIYQGQK